MLRVLIASIDRNGALPGPWQAVITVSGDSVLGPDSPEFAWARDYPVQFSNVDPELWAEFERTAVEEGRPGHQYTATIVHMHHRVMNSDVVIFMDADPVVTGSLAEVVRRAREEDTVLGCPAWFPPSVDLSSILKERGRGFPEGKHRLSGYGWSFLKPEWSPPYFNFGFVVCSREAVARLNLVMSDELRWVSLRHYDRFHCQVALCVAIVAHDIPYGVFDERDNYGNGPDMEPILSGPEGEALREAAWAARRDVRVMHYCVATPEFSKHGVMESEDAIRRFLGRTGLSGGNLRFQLAMRGVWWGGSCASRFKVTALVFILNDGAIVAGMLEHLIAAALDVYLIDGGSVDRTMAEAGRWLGRGLLGIETVSGLPPVAEGFRDGDDPKLCCTLASPTPLAEGLKPLCRKAGDAREGGGAGKSATERRVFPIPFIHRRYPVHEVQRDASKLFPFDLEATRLRLLTAGGSAKC